MAKGKIKNYIPGRGFGFIEPEGGGADMFFHINDVQNGKAIQNHIQSGLEVEYDVGEGKKGKIAAKNVRLPSLLGTGAESTPRAERQAPAPRHSSSTDYRFLNPYNFVRFLSPSESNGEQTKPAGALAEQLMAANLPQEAQPEVPSTHKTLLDKCPPPPHDRFVGLSGKITCTLETVTPLFISDAEKIERKPAKGGEEHKTYRFFQHEAVEHRYLLPGSSLRGMIRNVFEAATNSCMLKFDGARLSKHADPGEGRTLVPAIVDDTSDENWTLRLLTGTTTFDENGPRGDHTQPLYAAWLKRYTPIKMSKTAAQKPKSPYAQRSIIDIQDGLKHGSACAATLELMEHPERDLGRGRSMKPFWFWNVKELALDKESLQSKEGDGVIKVNGWLYLTNQNTDNKHDERFFFAANEDENPPFTACLDKTVRSRYEDLIRDYRKRHAEAVNKRKKPAVPEKTSSNPRDPEEPAFSRFILENFRGLDKNDLVYAKLKKDGKGDWMAEYIVPASLPRVAYEQTIAELLDDDVEACSQPDKLCPACRTFGWVHQLEEKAEKGKGIAYAGRVRFSNGTLQHEAKKLPEQKVTLAILSSPKPTTTSFYLLDRNGKPSFTVDYNTKSARLRGRKFYRHHGSKLDLVEYTRPNGKDGRPIRDGQNRTVKEVLDKGNLFTFTVDFSNLAPVELGALLWSLEMRYTDSDGQQQQLFHRLGFAKPLGFGSVKINIDALKLLNSRERYGAMTHAGWHSVTQENYSFEYVAPFKAAMQSIYGDAFESLDNVRDLIALLTEPAECDHIHYPRPLNCEEPNGEITKANPEGKQFEWFIGNKKARKELELACEDKTGLPLLTRRGEEVCRE